MPRLTIAGPAGPVASGRASSRTSSDTKRPGRPVGSALDAVPLARVIAVYRALRAEHEQNCWAAPRQIDLCASLRGVGLGGPDAGWSVRALRRYLAVRRVRWPPRRGGDFVLLADCWPPSSDLGAASSA